MPLRSDIFDPIPGDNPGGENLRYAPIYDKIKEARRQEDDAPQGEWARERKVADWPITIKLITETLATKTKDLQLAAWLTEALLIREGIPGLKEGLDALRKLIEAFWDNLYPELEDGDAEFRATPLEWVGARLDQSIKRVPLTRSGLDWFQYKESRAIGYEEDAASDERRALREAAVADGKPTAEDFDNAFNGTPKAFYVNLEAAYDGALESVDALGQVCDEKFGDVAPSFRNLRETLEEVRQTVHILLQKKRETEPEPAPGEEPVSEEPPVEEPAAYAYESAGAAAAPARAPAPAPARRVTAGAEPADRDDAVARVISAARYLRQQDAYSPAPYLLLRGLRWGELRANGDSIDTAMLEAPPTEVRQELKRLAGEGDWAAVLEAVEKAMGEPYGRAWLDLQRYCCQACYQLSYEAIRNAVRSELRSLLVDLPSLTTLTLNDDTPVANAETMAWIAEEVTPPAPEPEPAPAIPASPMEAESRMASSGEDAPPDAYDLAMEAVLARNPEEAIAILSREMAQERSGRARFNRKVQVAQICLAAGYDNVAQPILTELAAEIERRTLEDWEAADVLAHPLVLLYRCLNKVEGHEEEKRKLYARICWLDPSQALACK